MPRRATLETPRRIGAVFLFFCLSLPAYAQAETIRHVVIVGNHALSEKELLRFESALEGEPFSPQLAHQGAERVRKKSMRDFYPLASVKWKAVEGKPADQLTLIYTLERGPRGRVQEVRVLGNRILSDEELREQLNILPREGWWPGLLGQDALNPDDLAKDENAIRLAYLEKGYAAVDVAPAVLETHPEGSGFLLTWRIQQEGVVHGIGSIGFDTDIAMPEEVMSQLVPLEPDERYDALRVERVRAGLHRYLLENGHAFAQVDVSEQRIPAENRVNLVFTIKAGRRPVLRTVHIEGQSKTNPDIIRNEISLESGDPYSPLEVERSKVRVEALPMFTKTEMSVEGVPEAGVFDLRVWVQERKTGRIEGGVVYGDAEGAALQFNLSERNLDLIPPFRGGGYEAGFSATVGNEVIRGELRLTDPRVGDSDWSINSSIFYEDSEVVSDYYDQQSYGGQVIGVHPLSPHWSGSVGLSVLFAQLENIDRDALPDLDEVDEDMRLTSVVGFLGFDNTDQGFRPTRGVRGRVGGQLGTETLGGNVDIVSGTLKGSGFMNPYGDVVLVIKGGVDGMNPYGETEKTPQALKQYLGGSQTLRGFEYRSLSPLDEQGRPIGGDTRWWATAEVLLPVVADRMDVALFYDVGDVSPESFSFSGEGPVSNVGVGFAVRADNFPIRFNVAMPLETYEGDRTNEQGDIYISFAVGYTY